MLKIRTLAEALALSTVLAAPALAADMAYPAQPEPVPAPAPYMQQSGWYLRGDTGWGWLDYQGNNGNSFQLGGGIGYQVNDMFRADARFDYGFDYGMAKDQTASLGSILANGYIDIPLGNTMGGIKPYVGLGIGYGWVNQSPGSDEGGFATGIMAGVAFDVAPNWAIDVGYRNRMIFNNDTAYDNSVTIGARFRF
ncbi:MAG: outer membrane beta-barrel protein [Hyphomicrobiales bacterium]